jgi:ABC-type Fe3+-hydroxamate transport system substrate-binding protein
MAGGENVYKSTTMAVPSMSEEGVLALAPEAIIEIVTPPEPEHAIAHRRGSWREVRGLAAAQAGRVLVIGEDYAAIPGPRFVLLLEKIASFLHPR